MVEDGDMSWVQPCNVFSIILFFLFPTTTEAIQIDTPLLYREEEEDDPLLLAFGSLLQKYRSNAGNQAQSSQLLNINGWKVSVF